MTAGKRICTQIRTDENYQQIELTNLSSTILLSTAEKRRRPGLKGRNNAAFNNKCCN